MPEIDYLFSIYDIFLDFYFAGEASGWIGPSKA